MLLDSYSFPAFILGAVINVFTIPYVFVPAASLYSKSLPLKIQGTLYFQPFLCIVYSGKF